MGVMVLGSLLALLAADSYRAEIENWRRAREEQLKSDTGWLTIAGLFWLREGETTIGTDPESGIVLPEGSAPARLGVIEHAGGRTRFRHAEDPARTVELKPDTSGSPDMIRTGDVTFWVIRRGDRFAVRLRDKNSRFRKEFTGLRWYPVKPEYRITARYVAWPAPRKISVPSIIGTPEEMTSPGYVEFELEGRTVRLTTMSSGESLWFIFRDATSGKTTYAGGRFLYSDAPRDGKVIVDFNKAYNPPCVFTPYATCPLPPKENRLEVAIEAGEKNYPHRW